MRAVVVELALLNLTRNRRRTLLAMLPTAIGLAGLLVLWAFNTALHRNMTENFQAALVGSLQIHRLGFFEHPQLPANLGDGHEVIAAVEALGIESWTPRLEHFVLASGETATSGMMLIAIDPQRERRVTRLAERVTEGEFLRADAPRTALIGAGSAANLDVGVGEALVLVGSDRFGTPFAEAFTVSGIITSGEMGLDQGIVFVPLADAQAMLDMPGQITNVVLQVPARELDPLIGALRQALPGDAYEVLRWSDMFPVMAEWIAVSTGFQYLFVAVVALLVAAGVGNVVLVGMLAREHEFRVMLCIGTPSRGVRDLILLEALLIGVLGTVAGLALGLGLVALLGVAGIDLSALLGDTGRFYVDPVIRPALGLAETAIVTGAVFVVTQLAGMFPAARVRAINACDAVIRHV